MIHRRYKVDPMASLHALLGTYGVKTSLLETEADYWVCARALWPSLPDQDGATLVDLQKSIKRLSIKARRHSAIKNATHVPLRFFSLAQKHQAKLDASQEAR